MGRWSSRALVAAISVTACSSTSVTTNDEGGAGGMSGQRAAAGAGSGTGARSGEGGNGSMSSQQSGEGEIRKSIVEADLVDWMVARPGQLFYSTRDALLPRLLSGELSVAQAEQAVEATA